MDKVTCMSSMRVPVPSHLHHRHRCRQRSTAAVTGVCSPWHPARAAWPRSAPSSKTPATTIPRPKSMAAIRPVLSGASTSTTRSRLRAARHSCSPPCAAPEAAPCSRSPHDPKLGKVAGYPVVLFLGTGRYLGAATTFRTPPSQSIYAIKDNGGTASVGSPRSDLTPHRLRATDTDQRDVWYLRLLHHGIQDPHRFDQRRQFLRDPERLVR